jgi:hypothetical protein
MQVGFIRDGAGEVTLTGAAGMTLKMLLTDLE